MLIFNQSELTLTANTQLKVKHKYIATNRKVSSNITAVLQHRILLSLTPKTRK